MLFDLITLDVSLSFEMFLLSIQQIELNEQFNNTLKYFGHYGLLHLQIEMSEMFLFHMLKSHQGFIVALI